MEDNELRQHLAAMTKAAEERKEAEVKRQVAEELRLETEQERLQIERGNRAYIKAILDKLNIVEHSVSEFKPSDHTHMLNELQAILMLVQVIAVRVGGAEIEDVLKLVRGARTLEINTGDNTTIGAVVEGEMTGNVTQNVDRIRDALEANDIATVEEELNTLPGDAIDVALAALRGPMAAAKVIVKKVAGKWRLERDV